MPDEVIEAIPEIPWKQVKGMRIIAAHAYHRIDYEEVWVTCATTSREWKRRSSAGVRPTLSSDRLPGTFTASRAHLR